MRIIEGPADAGNVFGYFRRGLVPAGRFAVVEDGEYADGGHGPSLATAETFACRQDAVFALAAARLAGLNLSADLIDDRSGQTGGTEHVEWLASATDAEITDWASLQGDTVKQENDNDADY